MTRAPVKLSPPSLLDRAIAYIAPARGVERFRARAQMALAGQWLAGRTDRRATANWIPFGGSADADNIGDLRLTRARTRDMARNAPLALGAVNTVVTNVAGTGLTLRSTIDGETLGLTEEQAQKLQRQIEREFGYWAENPSECDATRTLDFYGQQALALRSALDSGDLFATLPLIKRRGCIYETKVQLIEADRVYNKNWAPNTDRLVNGIELDEAGAPVKCHIMKRHPGSLYQPASMEWDIVPVFGSRTGRRNVVHLHPKLRPGQTRGMPYLSPVVELLKKLTDYTDAEVQAAVISSFFTVFIKSPAGNGLDPGDGTDPATAAPGTDLKLSPGAILDLAPGEETEFADPKRPNTAFDPFVQAVLRQIGVALNLPFEVLIKHFTASYSAARAALLEAWKFYKGQRAWLALQFCQPIYEAWLEEAVAAGVIDAPGFFDDPRIRAAYCSADWVGDAQGQIDPYKEVQAAQERIKAGLSTHTRETAELTGADWWQEHAVLSRELAARRKDKTIQDLYPEEFADANAGQGAKPGQNAPGGDKGGEKGDKETGDAPAEDDAPEDESD